MASERDGRSEVRIMVLRIIFIAIFVLYTLRLFSMQVLRGDMYRSRAQNIARQTVVISAQRGEIYDRNFNQPLVSNANSFVVSIIPAEVPGAQMPEIIARLAGILGLQQEQIERRLPPSVYRRYQPVEIAANIPLETIAVLAEQAASIPGISWQSRPVRSYTEIGSLSHIIGYVGNITRDELTVLFNEGYQTGDIIGKNGIERQYDSLLRGREGRETRTVDARGRIIGGDSARVSPEMGKNLVLTIDQKIQTLAEKALGNRIGSVVVMRPSSGEILAMVSYPWFDPGIFNNTDTGAEFQALINDSNRPLLNRAIQANYPPASTFKVVMSTALLAENAFPPTQTIDCRGQINIGDRIFRCHIRGHGHGRLNLRQALAESCNIFFGLAGRDYLREENIVNYSRDFGFGAITGIDLPGEVSGFIPTPQWKERRLNERWVGGDTINMSIGQGYSLVTPLQMANMVAMVVNGGIIYTPHILKEVRDPQSGTVEHQITPRVLHKSEIPPSVFAQVRSDMRGVITGGTVQYTPLNNSTVAIAGKTGTAEVGRNDRWHSWFASYGPHQADNPDEQIVVSVIVEAANPWEWWAPFCSAIIFQGVFANQTYEEATRTLGIPESRLLSGRRE